MIKLNSIKRKFALWFILLSVLMSTIVVVFRTWQLDLEYQKWQKDHLQSTHTTVNSIFMDKIKSLALIARDNGIHNEAYEFVQTQTTDFAENYLTIDSLIYLDSHAVLVADNHGEMIHGVSRLSAANEAQLWQLLDGQIRVDSSFTQQSGIVLINDQAFLYVSSAITDSKRLQSPVGSITYVKAVDQAMMQDISKFIGEKVSLRFLPYEGNGLHFKNAFKTSANLTELISEDHQVSATFSLVSAAGEPIPAEVLIEKRNEEKKLNNPMVTITPALLGTSIVGMIFFWLINNMISKPIDNINQSLKGLIESPGRFKALTINVDNEFGELVKTTNTLLSKLFDQQEFSRLLLDSIGEVIVTIDEQGAISYLNPTAEQWFQLPENNHFGVKFDFVLVNEDVTSPSISAMVYDVLKKRQPIEVTSQFYCSTRQSESSRLRIAGRPLKSEENAEAGGIFVISRLNQDASADQ